jgi:hypothetical protein
MDRSSLCRSGIPQRSYENRVSARLAAVSARAFRPFPERHREDLVDGVDLEGFHARVPQKLGWC